MRFLAILAVSVTVLTPALAAADPIQPQTAPAASAQPAQPAPTAVQTAQAAPPAASDTDLDKIECRTSPPETGTRLGGKRECHTVRQWNQRQQDAQDELKRTQMNGHQFGMANPVSGTK